MAAIDIDGVTLAYEDEGSGSDVVVLVHGHPFDRTMWRPQLDAISHSGWRVLVPDLRGYGASTVTPGTVTLNRFARDAVALIDALGIDRVAIAGLSMGGQIAMEFCRAFPDRARGLLLAATFPQAETPAGKLARHAMADRLLREGMEHYARETVGRMLAPASRSGTPAVAEHVLRMMLNASPVGCAAALRGRAERPSYVPILASLTLPTLIVVGRDDEFTTVADARHMHVLARHSELLVLDGVGHMPNLEATAAFNRAMLDWLGSITAQH